MIHEKTKTKFLYLPLFYRNKMYWLSRVTITKNFNGYRYLVTNILKL